MKKISKKSIVIHAAGWVFAYLFFLWVLWGERPANPPLLAATVLLPSAGVFYSHLFLLTRCWSGGRKGWYLPGLLLLLLISPFLFMWASGLATGDRSVNSLPYLPFLVLNLMFVTLSWIVWLVQNRFIKALRKERLENQAVQAELSYLKSQINPHFLFNTLHNIHALVYTQAASAPDAVRSLSSLMRYMLYESNAPLVPLDREIAYLQDFISLQQLRYENGPVVDMEIVGDISSCQIVPLLLIHLLENAYKHSPARLNAGDIKIRLEVEDNSLTFCTLNPIRRSPSKSVEGPGGIGLGNVRKRLHLLYAADAYSLEAGSTDENFKVKLRIPYHHLQDYGRKTDMLYN